MKMDWEEKGGGESQLKRSVIVSYEEERLWGGDRGRLVLGLGLGNDRY